MTTLPIAWLVARAAGLVAFGLLTLSVWLGLAMSTRLLGPKRQKSLLGLHRTLCVDGALDDRAPHGRGPPRPRPAFRLAAALVPFAAPWKTGAIAAGVVAAWLSLALASSFRLRKWIGQKGWRRLHYASFAAFALSLGHALLVGAPTCAARRSGAGARRGGPGSLVDVLPIARTERRGRPRGGSPGRLTSISTSQRRC